MATRRQTRKSKSNPFGMWFEMATMAVEASVVIPLRLAKIAAGGAAATREANGMVVEKMVAANRAAVTLATGGSPEMVMRQFGRKVSSNRKRLSRG